MALRHLWGYVWTSLLAAICSACFGGLLFVVYSMWKSGDFSHLIMTVIMAPMFILFGSIYSLPCALIGQGTMILLTKLYPFFTLKIAWALLGATLACTVGWYYDFPKLFLMREATFPWLAATGAIGGLVGWWGWRMHMLSLPEPSIDGAA